MKRLSFVMLLFCITIGLTSCATIMHGTRQNIGISSNPTNASIWVDKKFVGETPTVIKMSRKDHHFIRIELAGYQPYEAKITRHVSCWGFGNIIFGGITGLAVDALSGGLYELTPDHIQAEMQKQYVGYSKNSKESFIFVVLEPNPSWKKIGNLVALK